MRGERRVRGDRRVRGERGEGGTVFLGFSERVRLRQLYIILGLYIAVFFLETATIH